MEQIGVIAGLCAACLQAFSYIMSRGLMARGYTPLQLLVCSQLWMGLASIAVLPWLWTEPQGGRLALAGALAFQIIAFIGAQVTFFWTMRHAAASRVSPLMGCKVIISALLAWSVRDEALNGLQILAVALTVVAAFAVMRSGERIPIKAIIGTGIVITCFACSDLGITLAADAIDGGAAERGIGVPLRVCIYSHVIMGFAALVCMPLLRRRDGIGSALPWRGAAGYAAIWLSSMLCLFTAFALIGMVYGGIAQSLRGPISVLLAVLVVRAGFVAVEAPRSRTVYLQQGFSALLMVAAIALYAMSVES